jgi:hypothetical protein
VPFSPALTNQRIFSIINREKREKRENEEKSPRITRITRNEEKIAVSV